ncbi:Wzz/FepE/Etk N-terminal domain-containing protein [Prauserella oleivorans]
MTSKDNSPSQPLLDVERLLTAIRRRRRLWTAVALLGLLVGAGIAVFLPPPPTATMRVLVIHEDDQPSDAGTLVSTDVAILQTTRIARAAVEDLRSTESPEDFLETYEATPLTNNVFEVSVVGTSDADAVRRAQAIGDAFVADHVRRVQAAADAEAQAVLDQRDRAQQELTGVDGSIAAAEAGEGNPATLETLYARRAELVSRISNLTDQAEDAGIGAPRVEAGTQLVDAPRPWSTRCSPRRPRTAPSASHSDSRRGWRWRWCWVSRGIVRCGGPTSPNTSARPSSRRCPSGHPVPPGCGAGPGRCGSATGSRARWPGWSAAGTNRCHCSNSAAPAPPPSSPSTWPRSWPPTVRW